MTTLSNANAYSTLVVSQFNAPTAIALAGRTLVYFNGLECPIGVSWSYGVTCSDAIANGWVLKDSAGNYLQYAANNAYILDIGNASYQQKFISNVKSWVSSHPGVDGIFIDNVLGHMLGSAYSTKYPSNATYRSGVLSFIHAVGPALKAAGIYVAANAYMYDAGATCGGQACDVNDGSQDAWWWKQVGRDVSALCSETWQQRPDTKAVRTMGPAWYQHWDGWQKLPSVAASMGDDFIAADYGDPNDTVKSEFLRGSYLLEFPSGRSMFSYTPSPSTTQDPWNAGWTFSTGVPLAAKTQVGAMWKRAFSLGTIYVNPTTSTQVADGITVAPTSARWVP